MVELQIGYGFGSPGATVIGLAVVSGTVAYRRRAPPPSRSWWPA